MDRIDRSDASQGARSISGIFNKERDDVQKKIEACFERNPKLKASLARIESSDSDKGVNADSILKDLQATPTTSSKQELIKIIRGSLLSKDRSLKAKINKHIVALMNAIKPEPPQPAGPLTPVIVPVAAASSPINRVLLDGTEMLSDGTNIPTRERVINEALVRAFQTDNLRDAELLLNVAKEKKMTPRKINKYVSQQKEFVSGVVREGRGSRFREIGKRRVKMRPLMQMAIESGNDSLLKALIDNDFPLDELYSIRDSSPNDTKIEYYIRPGDDQTIGENWEPHRNELYSGSPLAVAVHSNQYTCAKLIFNAMNSSQKEKISPIDLGDFLKLLSKKRLDSKEAEDTLTDVMKLGCFERLITCEEESFESRFQYSSCIDLNIFKKMTAAQQDSLPGFHFGNLFDEAGEKGDTETLGRLSNCPQFKSLEVRAKAPFLSNAFRVAAKNGHMEILSFILEKPEFKEALYDGGNYEPGGGLEHTFRMEVHDAYKEAVKKAVEQPDSSSREQALKVLKFLQEPNGKTRAALHEERYQPLWHRWTRPSVREEAYVTAAKKGDLELMQIIEGQDGGFRGCFSSESRVYKNALYTSLEDITKDSPLTKDIKLLKVWTHLLSQLECIGGVLTVGDDDETYKMLDIRPDSRICTVLVLKSLSLIPSNNIKPTTTNYEMDIKEDVETACCNVLNKLDKAEEAAAVNTSATAMPEPPQQQNSTSTSNVFESQDLLEKISRHLELGSLADLSGVSRTTNAALKPEFSRHSRPVINQGRVLISGILDSDQFKQTGSTESVIPQAEQEYGAFISKWDRPTD